MRKYVDAIWTGLGLFWLAGWSLKLGIYLFSSAPVPISCGHGLVCGPPARVEVRDEQPKRQGDILMQAK